MPSLVTPPRLALAVFALLLAAPLSVRALDVDPAAVVPAILAEADALPRLPAAITSFGAAVAGDWLYVYGGHIGKTHEHSQANLAAHFVRLDLRLGKDRAVWETLPMGRPLQGLALVGWQGKVIRIGGVEIRNAAAEPDDLHSTAEVELYDPAPGRWQALTPLPEGRSSHDAAILDDQLYVIGGWKMTGQSDDAEWAADNYVADLRVTPLQWKKLPPADFRQRALAVAATSKRIVVIGGLSESDEPCNAVHSYDPATQSWSHGPDFPAPEMPAAFAVSAFGVGDTIWASAAAGRLFALSEGDPVWRDTQRQLVTPRYFHRLLPAPGARLLFVAGATRKAHRDDTEAIALEALLAAPLSKLPAAVLPQKSPPTAQSTTAK